MDKHTEIIESSSDIETSAGNSVDRLPGVSSQSHAGSDSSDEEIVTRKKPARNQFVDSDDEMDGSVAGQPAAMNTEPEQQPVHSKPSPKQKRLKKRIVLPPIDSDTDGSENERDERRNMEKSAKDKSGVVGARARSQTKPVGNGKRKDSSNSKTLVNDSDSDYRSSKASVETVSERQTSKSDESHVSIQSKARSNPITSQKSTADNSPHSSPSNQKSTQSNSQRSSQAQSTSQKSSQKSSHMSSSSSSPNNSQQSTQSRSQKSSQSQSKKSSQNSSRNSSPMSSRSFRPNNSQKSTQNRSQKSSQSQSKKSSENSSRNSSPMSSRSSSPNNSHKATQSQSQKSTPSQSQKSVQNSTPNSHRSISQISTPNNSRNSSPRSSQRSKTSNSQQSTLNSSLNSTMNNSATASLSQESTVSNLDKSLEGNKRSQLETSARDSDSDDTIVNTSRKKSKAFKGKRVFDDDSDSDGSKANNISAKRKSDSSSESDTSLKVDKPEANKLKSKRRIIQHDDSDDMDTTPKNEKQAVKPRLAPAVGMRFSSEAEKDVPDWKKSILSAGLLDEESSDDGRRADSPDSPSVRQPSPSGKSKKERRKSKEIAARPKPKTLKSQKAAKVDKEKVHSETQRILRQAHVDLPYHVPRQRTLAEFMRGRTLGAAGGCASLKSSPHEMQKHWQQIEEREKEAIVFYKSESEPSEDETEKIGNSVLPHSQIKVPSEDPSLESLSTHITVPSLDTLPDSTVSGVDLGGRPRDSGAVKENNLCSIELLKSSHLGEQSLPGENKIVPEIENAVSDDIPQQKTDMVLGDGDIVQLENKSTLLLGSDNQSRLELQAENPTAVSLESEPVSTLNLNPEPAAVTSTGRCQAISSFAAKHQSLLDEIDDSNDGSIMFQLSDSDESQHASEKTEKTVLEGSDNLSEDCGKMQKRDNGIIGQTVSDTLKSLSEVTTSDKLQKGGSGTEEPKLRDTLAILTEVATSLERQKGVDGTEERKVTDTSEISTEVETKNEPKPVRRNVFGRDYADLSSDSDGDVAAATGKSDERLAKLRKRSLVDVGNVRPRLSGGSDTVIDLDVPTKKSGVIDLLQRFIKHSAKPKTNKTPTELELSVVSAEKAADGSMEVKKELVTVLLDGGADESRDPVPGAKLKRLRLALEQQMAQRRSAEWQRKMEEEKQNNEVLEDGEKSDCGMLDDEEEMSNSEEDEEDEEEEEEGDLEENDVALVESKREKSGFLDGEAEVSDDGDDADISDDEEEEEEEEEDKEVEEKTTVQETDNATASQDGNTVLENTQGRSKFRRLKTLDMFDSDEEGDNARTDKWNGSAMDDSFPTSTMIPAGQRCNSPTPSPTVLSPMKYNRRTGATQEPSFVLPLTPTQRSAPAVDESEFFSTQDYLNEMMNGVPRKPKPVASALKGLSQLFSKPITADSGDDDDLLGLCSGKFPSQPSQAVAGAFEDDSELLSLCSGRFTPQSQVDQSQVGQSQVDQSEHGVKDSVSLKAQPESQLQRSERKAGEDEGTVSKLPAASSSVVMTSNEIRLELASTDDEADALFPDNSAEQRKKRKLQKKLDFSDEEEDADDDKENESNDELGESDPEMVDYDSEENEVPVTDVGGGGGKHKKSSRVAREFLDAEAELTESEWGSADEDEQGLDQLDRLDGDDEHFDQEEMKEQIGKIHMRQVLDADKREVRMLQELLFEDGDLHSEGGGRERKFRWRNVDDGDVNDGLRNDDSGGEGGLEDEEEDQQWRIMRHQRETFLREQKEKAEAAGQPDVGILGDEDSQLLQLGKAALKRIRSVRSQHQLTMATERSRVAVRRAASESVLSPDPKRSCHPLMKRGSFLARGEQALARLAELTRNSAGTVVLNTKNSRNFVFATISPKEEADAEEPVKKVIKRKATQVTPSVLKKTKVADDKSKGRRLFDHLT